MSFNRFARLGKKPIQNDAWQPGDRESDGVGFPLRFEAAPELPDVVEIPVRRDGVERARRTAAWNNLSVGAPLEALAAPPVPDQITVLTLPVRRASRAAAIALAVPILAPIQPVAYPAVMTETTVTYTQQVAYQQKFVVLDSLATVDESPYAAKVYDLPTRREKRRVVQPLAFLEPVTDGVETRLPQALPLPTRRERLRVKQESTVVQPVTDGQDTQLPQVLPQPTYRAKKRVIQPLAFVEPVTDGVETRLSWDFRLAPRTLPRRQLLPTEYSQPDLAGEDVSVYPAPVSTLSVRIKPRRPLPETVIASGADTPGSSIDSRLTVAYPLTIAYQPKFIVLDSIAEAVVYPTGDQLLAPRINPRRPLPIEQVVQPVTDGVETRLPVALSLPTRRERLRVVQPTAVVQPVIDGTETNAIWTFQFIGRRPVPRRPLPETILAQELPVNPALFVAVSTIERYRPKLRVLNSPVRVDLGNQPEAHHPDAYVMPLPTRQVRQRVIQPSFYTTVVYIYPSSGYTVRIDLPVYTEEVALPEYGGVTELPVYSLNINAPLYNEATELPNYTFVTFTG